MTHVLAILSFIGSGIAIVRAFGIFCLTNVPINFIFITFYFPCWLVLHEKFVKRPFDYLWDCFIDLLFCRKCCISFDCSWLKCNFSNCFNCEFCCLKCKCDCICFRKKNKQTLGKIKLKGNSTIVEDNSALENTN